MVISSEFRMGEYIDDDHREDAPHFIIDQCPIILFENMPDLIKIEWFNGKILKLRIML